MSGDPGGVGGSGSSGLSWGVGSGSSPPPSPSGGGPSGRAYSRGDGVFGSSGPPWLSSTGFSKAESRVLLEGERDGGAAPLAREMLLGRAEIPKVLRACTGVRGSPVLRVALRPGMVPARLELSVVRVPWVCNIMIRWCNETNGVSVRIYC